MSTEMKKLENVKKSCKTISTVVKVLEILAIIVLVISVLSAIICGVNRDKINAEAKNMNPEELAQISDINFTTSLAGLDMTYALDNRIQDGDLGFASALVLGTAAVILVFALVILIFIKKVFDTILASESPFAPEVLKNIKNTFIFFAIFLGLASGIGIGVFMGLLGWSVYTIFQYGAELQQQADETL